MTLDPDLWEDFKTFRKELKHPLTKTAERRLLAKLERLAAEGHDINAAIEASIECGWRGVFAPKKKPQKPVTGWKAYARDHGIEARPGETWDAFERRVEAMIQRQDRPPLRLVQ